ncbi:putative 30S ribosomal protein S13 [Orientia tsutsugamushi str. Gilliam]|uniref:Putative 30S ribosomal protein S13 n=1 Tax=Orientia tsutsugamushi str. Gilliam TaxID=1359184 RepID=A0A0F3M7B5_ORITS|nr:putative 30S ribosomal protein S13 [Orientia tsutsugamushi str. Gilliam]
MARISNVNVPTNKRVMIGLTYIYMVLVGQLHKKFVKRFKFQ